MDVLAKLNYLIPGAEPPHSYACEPPAGTPWESGTYEGRVMRVADARAMEPRLDREGFEMREAPTEVTDFLDAAHVTSIYYREAAALALEATGASRAYVFDHLVRRRERDRQAVTFGRRTDGRPAVNGRIHNDYTEASGRHRLAKVIEDPREAARVRRFAIVNVWRSIAGPVRDTPLAVCDARSVMASDLIEGRVHYPKRVGEIYHAAHSPLHRWSYFPAMDRHEALVFKQYDSQVSGTSRFVLHAAFDLPDVPEDAPLRESIELRCLVVHD